MPCFGCFGYKNESDTSKQHKKNTKNKQSRREVELKKIDVGDNKNKNRSKKSSAHVNEAFVQDIVASTSQLSNSNKKIDDETFKRILVCIDFLHNIFK